MEKPVRSIARKLMHCVVSLSIVCAYSQNSNAGPHAKHYTMQGAYIDYFAGVGRQARWEIPAYGLDHYVYFMDETYFGNHEVLSGNGSFPGTASASVVKAAFDENIDIAKNYGISSDLFTNQTAHRNFYYMWNKINKSLLAAPTADVPYAGVKIPNVIARALQQTAIDLTKPVHELKISPVAQTADLKCSATTATASGVTPQVLPNCCSYVRLFFVFQFLNSAAVFVRWRPGHSGGRAAWQGAVIAVVSSLAFFWYEYENARDATVAAEAAGGQVQADRDEAYRTARAADQVANMTGAVARAAADELHGGDLELGIRDIATESVNVTLRAANEAASTASSDSPPTLPPLTCHF